MRFWIFHKFLLPLNGFISHYFFLYFYIFFRLSPKNPNLARINVRISRENVRTRDGENLRNAKKRHIQNDTSGKR